MKRLLLIEDEDISYLFLKGLLGNLGYGEDRIKRCVSLGALAEIEPEDIEIVITDLTLPDSLYSATFGQVMNKFPYVPIIVLTGTTELEVAINTIQLGAQDYLVKGEINKNVLGKAIRYAVERKKITNDYERLFNNTPTPMYIFDNDTFKFIAVNAAAISQYGYGKEEFLQITAGEIMAEEDLESFYRLCKSVNGSFSDAGQWRHIKKSGEIFYAQIYIHFTQFEGKNARVVQAIDVNEKVKTEIALHEKMEEINTVLESITDGFFLLDNEWKFLYVNKESEKILRNKRASLIGRRILDFLPEIKTMKFYSECKRAVAEQASVHFEEHYEGYDVWLMVNAYPSKEGLAVYFADITEQKKSQEKIFVEKQNLRATINNTRDIIWSVNRSLEIMSGNKAFWERIYLLSGKRKKEVHKEDFNKEVFDVWISYYERAFKGEAYKIIWTEIAIGRIIYEEVSFNPIYDKEKKVIGVSCFSRDITEQRTYLNQIEKQNEQLRKIAWVQSHEVRSPVANILGLAQLFNHCDIADPFNKEILENIVLSTKKLDQIITKINSYTYTSKE